MCYAQGAITGDLLVGHFCQQGEIEKFGSRKDTIKHGTWRKEHGEWCFGFNKLAIKNDDRLINSNRLYNFNEERNI
ncbi:hypothetical protein BpHYR1_028947 [Brachionus plicatilis]|uniref:Uncharacterized protein n=1 Tax=Brachionus plicatilis TaxID=10195 RepID=A0A3M7PRK6_BRAPC|nr:hypothetical protein BpHYR1_028947 [Brachionus plicatilis]